MSLSEKWTVRYQKNGNSSPESHYSNSIQLYALWKSEVSETPSRQDFEVIGSSFRAINVKELTQEWTPCEDTCAMSAELFRNTFVVFAKKYVKDCLPFINDLKIKKIFFYSSLIFSTSTSTSSLKIELQLKTFRHTFVIDFFTKVKYFSIFLNFIDNYHHLKIFDVLFTPVPGVFPADLVSLPFSQHLSITEAPKPFPCHKCGRSYRNKGSLKRHLVDECGRPPGYICNICQKGFKQKANYHRHAATIHGRVLTEGLTTEKSRIVTREIAGEFSGNSFGSLVNPAFPTKPFAFVNTGIKKPVLDSSSLGPAFVSVRSESVMSDDSDVRTK
ncbi:uncharacterized protein LOC117182879 [Belonocnema kinseyi]|uniref:uncharacterized protein LOC117182879 n=1 Tax=Belonocnema kinseyi TaxID=2817044 RepID=UPI00143DDE6A|nr:uncharacterized protein LOC117182879 [Belonocnema kinseyi]